MPITAKFSKEFYDRLGHEVTDELVNWLNQMDASYRGELRDLNDLNFQRFDAKLEQRVTQLDAKWDQRFAQLDAKWDRRFVELDAKWDRRIAELEPKWERKLAQLDARLTWRMFLMWTGTLATLIALLKL
jgi:hypothetical protein